MSALRFACETHGTDGGMPASPGPGRAGGERQSDEQPAGGWAPMPALVRPGAARGAGGVDGASAPGRRNRSLAVRTPQRRLRGPGPVREVRHRGLHEERGAVGRRRHPLGARRRRRHDGVAPSGDVFRTRAFWSSWTSASSRRARPATASTLNELQKHGPSKTLVILDEIHHLSCEDGPGEFGIFTDEPPFGAEAEAPRTRSRRRPVHLLPRRQPGHLPGGRRVGAAGEAAARRWQVRRW